MYRHVLFWGLLASVAPSVYAAECDVSVVLQGDSVEFDPFNPEATQLSLEIVSNKAYTNVSVKFAGSLTSVYSDSASDTSTGGTVYSDATSNAAMLGASTLAGYPDYLIGNTTFTSTYFDSNTSTTFADVVTGANWISGGTNTYSLSVKPDSQSQNDTALSPLSQNTLTLPVIIEGTDGTTACAGVHNVTMAIHIPAKTTVSFSDANFSNVDGSLDAGTVGRDASVTKTSTLYIWSNATYRIKAVSENGGVMIREQGSGAAVNNSEINKLPYKLNFNTSPSFFIGRDDITAATSPIAAHESVDESATLVKGGKISIDFTTQDTGKRAGDYTDTVTISILPQL